MRQLMLLRHAKSGWDDGQTDHARTITEHGRNSAALVGAHLKTSGLLPQLVLCSSAVRARSTLDLAMEAGGWSTAVTETDALYNTNVAGAMAVIAEAPDVGTLLVVGHEPTWSSVIHALTGNEVVMRTATLVVLELDRESWADIEPDSSRIISVTHAHQLAAE
ncbi:MAG: phosphohistidine phosphatase [Nitriliruptoraceae bacterium]|jgi:phosphohistidine phosphatase